METAHYDMMRHFADSWGLLYMMAIFLAVVFFIVKPGARGNALEAARIPLEDEQPRNIRKPEDGR
jgi:cytochrome c oxidase cbb3-type subunit 4